MDHHHKPGKPKNKFLNLLPKAATAVKFQSHQPFSPGRDHHGHKRSTDGGGGYGNSKLRYGTSFSGPFVSMIPEEARRRPKFGTHRDEEDDYVEPTSPKVSCMGQIKLKKEKAKQKHAAAKIRSRREKGAEEKVAAPSRKGTFKKLFRRSNSDACSGAVGAGRQPVVHEKVVLAAAGAAPGLGQINRFASGREGFKNFDWTAQIAPVESDHKAHGNGYYSDEDDFHGHGLDTDSEDEDDEVIIPFSAPMSIGGGGGGGGLMDLKPRTEVNLWKRRTMNRPRRLQLD